MGLELIRRDLNHLYNNLDRMYNIVYRILENTVKHLKEWRQLELEEQLYIVESLMDMVEEQATFLIAKYQPLGPELLEAKSIIRVSYDLYRITRYCREITRLINYIRTETGIEISREVEEATETVKKMVEYSYKSYRTNNRELKEKVKEMDDIIDNIYTKMLTKLAENKQYTQPDVINLLIIRHLERIADHAVYITKHID